MRDTIHSEPLSLDYDLVYFQVCLVHLQLEQFSRKSVEIDPKIIEMLSPIELTQYYIQVRFNCWQFDQIFLSEMDPWLHWSWHSLLWSQDGDHIQETHHEWTPHHLSPIMPSFINLLFHNILQIVLFWGTSHCQSVCHAGHHKPLHQVLQS